MLYHVSRSPSLSLYIYIYRERERAIPTSCISMNLLVAGGAARRGPGHRHLREALPAQGVRRGDSTIQLKDSNDNNNNTTTTTTTTATTTTATTTNDNNDNNKGVRRGDDTVGNPRRAQISQFELFELILVSKLDERFPVEQFEATASQSTVPYPPLLKARKVVIKCSSCENQKDVICLLTFECDNSSHV